MAKKTQIDVNEYLAHFNTVISKEIEEYSTETVFLNSRYLFTEREGRSRQYGYCTYCKHEYLINNPYEAKMKNASKSGLAHNQITTCRCCGSQVIVKSSGMHRKRLVDRAYFVYFDKSKIDPNTIVAYGISAYHDYRNDFRDVDTMHRLRALYVFQPGKSVMMKLGWWESSKWEVCSSVYSLFENGSMSSDPDCVNRCSWDSIDKAVAGTPFRYSTYESYIKDDDSADMVTFFDMYSKYPSIEYLTKLGFGKLIKEKLQRGRTYGAINWTGKNPVKVLKLTKQEINELRENKMEVSFSLLHLVQKARKDKSALPIQDIYNASEKFHQYIDELGEVLRYSSLRQALNYISKQKQVIRSTEHQALITWRDYLKDCIELGRDMADEAVIFPKNIETAHQNSMIQRKVKDNLKYDKAIRDYAKSLRKKRCFEYEGLLIRPAASAEEVITEGNILHHCVGGYVERYSKRETEIHFIRRVSDPDKPFFTVEIRNNQIFQYQGKNNQEKSAEVDAFIKIYKEEKLSKKLQDNRVRITVPA
jgi:hypothetical protein